MLDIKLGFLQFINVPVNLLQLVIVRSAIEITIGCLRNVAQRPRIYLYRNIDVLYSSCHRHWIRSHLVGSNTDGVNAYSVAFGNLCCGHWRDFTHVVTAVGKKNHNLRF